jgi:hypothetical protein
MKRRRGLHTEPYARCIDWGTVSLQCCGPTSHAVDADASNPRDSFGTWEKSFLAYRAAAIAKLVVGCFCCTARECPDWLPIEANCRWPVSLLVHRPPLFHFVWHRVHQCGSFCADDVSCGCRLIRRNSVVVPHFGKPRMYTIGRHRKDDVFCGPCQHGVRPAGRNGSSVAVHGFCCRHCLRVAASIAESDSIAVAVASLTPVHESKFPMLTRLIHLPTESAGR